MNTRRRHDALPEGFFLQGTKYRIGEELGSGGFGITYKAYQPGLNRDVAIKELLPVGVAVREGTTYAVRMEDQSNGDFLSAKRSFLEEAEKLAKFKHSHIIRVFDQFEENGTAYIVAEYHHSERLLDWLRRRHQEGKAMDEAALRKILGPMLDALEAVHEAGVLHLDVKPENILVTFKGEIPILIDFGSARQEVADRTRNTVMVSRYYAPHELYMVHGPQGQWSDIYSLAAVMHFAIRGETIPDGQERANATIPDAYVPLVQTHHQQYPPGLLGAIDRALSVHTNARPQTIADFREALGWDNDPNATVVVREAPPRTKRNLAVLATAILTTAGLMAAWLIPRHNVVVKSRDFLKQARELADNGKIGESLQAYQNALKGDEKTQAEVRSDLDQQLEEWRIQKPDVDDENERTLIDGVLPLPEAGLKDAEVPVLLESQLDANFAQKAARDSALEKAKEEFDKTGSLTGYYGACEAFSAHSATPEKRLRDSASLLMSPPREKLAAVKALQTMLHRLPSKDTYAKSELADLEEFLKLEEGSLAAEELAEAHRTSREWPDAVHQFTLAAEIQHKNSTVAQGAWQPFDQLLDELTKSIALDDQDAQELAGSLEDLAKLPADRLAHAKAFADFIRGLNDQIEGVKRETDKVIRTLDGVKPPTPNEPVADRDSRIKENNRIWREAITKLSELGSQNPTRTLPASELENRVCKAIATQLKEIDLEWKDLDNRRRELDEETITALTKLYKSDSRYGYAAQAVAEALAIGNTDRETEALEAAGWAWERADPKRDRGAFLMSMILNIRFKKGLVPNIQDVLDPALACVRWPDASAAGKVDCCAIAGKIVVEYLDFPGAQEDQVSLKELKLTDLLTPAAFNEYPHFSAYLGKAYLMGYLDLETDLKKSVENLESALGPWRNKNGGIPSPAVSFRCQRDLMAALVHPDVATLGAPERMEFSAKALQLEEEARQLGDGIGWLRFGMRQAALDNNLKQKLIEIYNKAAQQRDIEVTVNYDKLLAKQPAKWPKP